MRTSQRWRLEARSEVVMSGTEAIAELDKAEVEIVRTMEVGRKAEMALR